ncbi:unnamed protein product [Rhizoctonia solani]|uniref:SWIM-type domain-containing protein n=1 Tax=Rhizoctonia solani TaxID=456999 RepID=A0A8H3CJY0_9AGAM|nr:unnamed protein product [Rhizoctonia solani]
MKRQGSRGWKVVVRVKGHASEEGCALDRRRHASQAPVAYLSPDPRRDEDAQLLLKQNKLSSPKIHTRGIELTCTSTQSTDVYGRPLAYNIWLGFDQIAMCTCPDFQQRGGACKHMRAALCRVHDLQSWVRHHQIHDPIAYTPKIELPSDKAAAVRMIATQYGSKNRNSTHEDALHIDSGPAGTDSAVERAARCVNETLQAGLFGDLGDIDGSNEVEIVDSDSEGYEEEGMSSGNELLSWSSGDESRLASNSARGVVEQILARSMYDIKQQMRKTRNIRASLDRITHRDLNNTRHQRILEQFANEEEALLAQVRGLLRGSARTFESSQTTATPFTQTQRNAQSIPLPPSPEKRQYRKESRSIH